MTLKWVVGTSTADKNMLSSATSKTDVAKEKDEDGFSCDDAITYAGIVRTNYYSIWQYLKRQRTFRAAAGLPCNSRVAVFVIAA